MDITLRYGRHGLPVGLPDRNVQHVLRFHAPPPLRKPALALRQLLHNPLGCPSLREVAAGRRNACIVTADITRPLPNAIVLATLLEELQAAGLPPERVTILIGTGLHRPNGPAELREMLGDKVLSSGVRIVNHVARDVEGQVGLGMTKQGTPVLIDRTYVEADLKLSVSLVEPHLMAGFSGGRKALCPGICGAETILRFHAPPLLEAQTACAGVLDGNPVHEEALAIATLAGRPDLTVNVTLDEDRQVTGIFVGELESCHIAAVRQSVAQSKIALPEPVDIVVTTNAGYPLDLTFYQGVKGMIAAMPILKPGGTIIIAHECAEGIGGPEFSKLILGLDSLDEFVEHLRNSSDVYIDQWQLEEQVKVLRHADEIMSLSGGIPDKLLARCFVTPISSIEEGLLRALRKHGSQASIAVIPEGPYVLACLAGDLVDKQPLLE
ncbi:MAG: nickel-dependent lactate racemase [Candidatus Zipacnadales bacterium]